MRLPQPWEAISIHALLAESDGQTGGYRTARMSFLSTLSLRRATNTLRGLRRCTANFYPRSPCGERPQAHAPGRPAETFLSTLSLRRATLEDVAQRVGISYFYPRSPCGERRYASAFPQSMQYFYPRSPCGERRVRQVILAEPFIFISIHALLAESDSRVFMLMPSMRYFYPRSPCGERLTVSTLKILAILFLSTLSLRRATTTSAGRSAFRRHFYPRSPCGERLECLLRRNHLTVISIHALLAESDLLSC